MGHLINKNSILWTGQIIAFWPVWKWYILRITDNSDEPWGILALITVFLLTFQRKRKELKFQNMNLLLPALLTLLYSITFHFFHPLFRGMIVVTVIGSILSFLCYGRPFHTGIWLLLLWSLPIVASLQFYMGYPLRVLTGFLSAPLIHLAGFDVIPEGTTLKWRGELILIDAPCSGIRMLWVGLYLTFTLTCFRNLSPMKTIVGSIGSLLIIIFANSIRASALFFTEAKIINLPSWSHEGIGIMVFLCAAILITWLVKYIDKRPGAAAR